MRRRVGSAGSGRHMVLEQLRGSIDAGGGPPASSLGLAQRELRDLFGDRQLEDLARAFPWRGDPRRLRQIAWWGSALGDIATADRRPAAGRCVLREAACFNLAIALFDSVVDECSEHVPTLVRELDPVRIKTRLQAPRRVESALRCDDPALRLLVELFDAVFASIGRRLARDGRRLDHLIAVLEAMLRSELGLSRNPFEAKTLPIVFIGSLPGGPTPGGRDALFDALARFLWMWDDWIDIVDDMRGLRANAFLGECRLPASSAVGYMARSLGRLAGGRRSYVQLAEGLREALDLSLQASRECGHSFHTKTVALCSELVA